jgi:hypothetical protein
MGRLGSGKNNGWRIVLELNALLRGQSNAMMFNYLGGFSAMKAEAERLLGFDGVNDRLNLISSYGNEGANTIHSATAFLKDWLQAHGGDWTQGWDLGTPERQMLQAIASQPAELRDNPTAVVWLHSEYDSQRETLATAEWESALRFDAAQVRAAFGQAAAEIPYLFVNALPYDNARDTSNQAIKQGMAALAADPGFDAAIAAQAGDLDMDYDGNYGGSHMGAQDAATLAERLALSVAQNFAEYARPGSLVAAAGGAVDDLGPEVVGVETVSGRPDQLLLTVDFDAATALAPLDAAAAGGAGWSVQSGSGTVEASSAALAGASQLLLTFGQSLPADAVLHYGYGRGRITAADGSGEGHAVYDDQGVPVWTPPEGIPVGTAATSKPASLAVLDTPSSADWEAVSGAVDDNLANSGHWYL